jgi:hypothetical protein
MKAAIPMGIWTIEDALNIGVSGSVNVLTFVIKLGTITRMNETMFKNHATAMI